MPGVIWNTLYLIFTLYTDLRPRSPHKKQLHFLEVSILRNLVATIYAPSNARGMVARKELHFSPRNKNKVVFIPLHLHPLTFFFRYQVLFSAKEDVNDLISILNNGTGKADISQSLWSMMKLMKVASYSGQAYKGLKFSPCLKGQVN